MKKMIFAVLAAFVMSLGFVSCSGGPEDQFIGAMKDMVSALKGTTIKSADDVKQLKEKVEKCKKDIEAASLAMMNAYKDKPEDLKKVQEKINKEMESLGKDAEAETKRLKEEAEKAGVDISDLELD